MLLEGASKPMQLRLVIDGKNGVEGRHLNGHIFQEPGGEFAGPRAPGQVVVVHSRPRRREQDPIQDILVHEGWPLLQ